MKTIDLVEFFSALEKKQYCIIKLDPMFPEYKNGSDIDMFCMGLDEIAKKIISIAKKYLEFGYEISIAGTEKEKQIQIDIVKNNQIEIRFDLYGALPHYKNLLIKPAFFESVVEGRQKKYFSEKGLTVYIPSVIDELIVRYFDYQEWYGQRPDKIKHVDYINSKLDSPEVDKELFFARLHYYTEIPRIYVHGKPAGLSAKRKIKAKIKSLVKRAKGIF